jgi:hypothetical protein
VAFHQMSDFDATEGYTEAGDRRADSGAPKNAGAADPTPEESVAGAESTTPDDPLRRRLSNPYDPGVFAPSINRMRELSAGRPHFIEHQSESAVPTRRLTPPPLARRRKIARRSCPFGWRVFLLGGPSLHHRHRRLGIVCHRQPPGSPR